MIKKLGIGTVVILMLAGCVEEEIRSLQTDQSVEGEEAYWISSLLDEHLTLLWQPQSFYTDSAKIAGIPGCPKITSDSTKNEVTVDFDGVDCMDLSGNRSGKLLLTYTHLASSLGYRLDVSYADYTVQGNKITGLRTLNTIAQNRDKRVFSDVSSNLLIEAENKSSSRVNFTLSHEIFVSGNQITQGKSTGTGKGRNWVGRELEWVITEPKNFLMDCPEKVQTRPNSGEETWTITRSNTSDVVHRLTFYSEPDCISHTIIRLDEGVEMKKAP